MLFHGQLAATPDRIGCSDLDVHVFVDRVMVDGAHHSNGVRSLSAD